MSVHLLRALACGGALSLCLSSGDAHAADPAEFAVVKACKDYANQTPSDRALLWFLVEYNGIQDIPKPIPTLTVSDADCDAMGKGLLEAEWVTLDLESGESLSGAIIFNEFKGTGRLINVEEEISFDFNVDQIVDVKI